MSQTIFRRGLMLVAVPLTFELVVFGALIQLNEQAEQAARRAECARQINDEVSALLQSIFSINRASRGNSLKGLPLALGGQPMLPNFLMSANPDVIRKDFQTAQSNVFLHINRLKVLAKDDPQILKVVERTETAALIGKADLEDVRNQIQRQGFDHLNEILDRSRVKLDADLRQMLSPQLFDLAQHRAGAQDEHFASEARERFRQCLGLAVFMSFTLAIFVAALFSKSIASRLDRLRTNAVLLAQHRQLLPVMRGTDEIAELDRAYHDAADLLIASEEKLQTTFDNAADLICSLSERTTIMLVNKACERILQQTAHELLGIRMQTLIVSQDRQIFLDTLERSKENPDVSIKSEVRLIGVDGNLIDTVIICRWSARQRNYFCVFHDISERKRAEAIKREVLAMVTHDLRAPVTSFSNFVEMISLGEFGELNLEGAKFLHYATKSVSKMERLLDDILTLEKLKSGTIQPNRTSIKAIELLTEVAATMQVYASKHHVNIEVVDTHEYVRTDRVLVEKMLSNFLSNALRAAPPDSTVKLSCYDSGAGQVFAIQDQGAGIDQDKLPTIFDRFSQATSGSDDMPSSGLGLTITKELATLLGGEIHVRTENGAGSTFMLLLR